MSKTNHHRDHHYVPIWYQKGFFEPERLGVEYLDLNPPVTSLPNGRSFTARSLFPNNPPARCFFQTDLYTTFFGSAANVEIETMLFGDLDTRGSAAVRAMAGTDVGEWHRHFGAFFEYLDAQKLRTPKGLEWLKLRYPKLGQNELMREMQAVRMMHSTLWAEGVREVVSAEDAGVKFIISDHPITVYNHALPPDHPDCAYPKDPQTTLKASQTIYPLTKDYCIILTNLEYAQNPDGVDPLEKRTFAKNFRHTMMKTDAFIRTRKLNDSEVAQINYIIKARARRYIAAGRREWLTPEASAKLEWHELRHVLLPPTDGLWHFGGELYAGMEDGTVIYQDQFGRSQPVSPFLQKPPADRPPGPNDNCGCGSGAKYKKCCRDIPARRRPSWTELSLRERNQIHYRAIIDTLGLDKGKTWTDVRRDLTDDQIRNIYGVFAALWPLDTDLLALLPKPDGRARAVFTGIIDPPLVLEYVMAAPLYFGPVLVQNPFIHPDRIKPDMSPTKTPHLYRQDILKCVTFMLDFMPYIDRGIINLFPDPCIFDPHLQRQMFAMADQRIGAVVRQLPRDPRDTWGMEQHAKRSIRALPEDVQRARLAEMQPELDERQIDDVLRSLRHINEEDPLTPLSGINPGKEGGLLNIARMSPNLEIALYLAQATGSFIVTDSRMRWMELHTMRSLPQEGPPAVPSLPQDHLSDFQARLQSLDFHFPLTPGALLSLWHDDRVRAFQSVIKDAFAYLVDIPVRGVRPHLEGELAIRLKSAHAAVLRALRKLNVDHLDAEIRALLPNGGLGDPTINRLMLTSGVDHYLERVPMAFFIERTDKDFYLTHDPTA